jgi:dephospho-CoA kinase
MSLIILEGADRSGKSTVAEYYKKQGYEYIHFAAPDKKYTKSGYTGPSYLDDMVALLMSKINQDVIFDRSHYGERIWPYVYDRIPLLDEDDMEILREVEGQCGVRRILMVDHNKDAHWQRCVENKEPLNKNQFNLAHMLYIDMAEKYGFEVITMPDFLNSTKEEKKPEVPSAVKEQVQIEPSTATEEQVIKLTAEQQTLERANAINSILRGKRLFKQQGWQFDEIEDRVRAFLKDQLGELLGMNKIQSGLTPEDISIVKEFVKRLRDKQGAK